MQVIWNADDSVLPWACEILGVTPDYFEKARCAGIVSSDGKALAAAIYSDYFPAHKTMQLTFAAKSPKWATRQVVKSVLMYPFEVCGVQKLWTCTSHTNERALKLNRGLGFKQEGLLARHLGRNDHAVICRMFQEDYVRLWGKNGEKSKKRTNARSGSDSASTGRSE